MRIRTLACPLCSLLISSLALANLEISVDAAPIPSIPLSELELAVFSLDANQNDSPAVTARPKPSPQPEAARPPAERRPPVDELDQTEWLAIMMAHRFSTTEIADVFGISPDEANQLVQNTKLNTPDLLKRVPSTGAGVPVVLPYPGGRHPRIGFLEGAVRPQRETKVSLFAPWKDGGYVVIDLPEAVWHQPDGKRELLYLAHTHVPTIWDKQQVTLNPLEWNRKVPATLQLERVLPNQVTMISRAKRVTEGLRMEFSIANHSKTDLTGLHVQMCAMLKGLVGFDEQTNDNKIFQAPFAACKDRSGNRWVILAFDHCHRAWGNPPCPCLHSDPQVPDCAAGETQVVRGWASFYEGTDIKAELKRLEKLAFEPITQSE
jgi:hypothetical protein